MISWKAFRKHTLHEITGAARKDHARLGAIETGPENSIELPATQAKGASVRGWQCVLAVRLGWRLAGAWLALASA